LFGLVALGDVTLVGDLTIKLPDTKTKLVSLWIQILTSEIVQQL